MARSITPQETALEEMVARARSRYGPDRRLRPGRVDRLAQAIGWALGNETTFTRLAHMSVDESGIGDRDGRGQALQDPRHPPRRAAHPERGVIEDDPVKGLVKYAKPAGVIASIVPMTNPELTPPGTAIYAIEARTR